MIGPYTVYMFTSFVGDTCLHCIYSLLISGLILFLGTVYWSISISFYFYSFTNDIVKHFMVFCLEILERIFLNLLRTVFNLRSNIIESEFWRIYMYVLKKFKDIFWRKKCWNMTNVLETREISTLFQLERMKG